MGEAAKIIENNGQILETSPLIIKILKAIGTIGHTQINLDSEIKMPVKIGMSMPLADISSGIIYVTLNDDNLENPLPLEIKCNLRKTRPENIIDQLAIFQRNQFDTKKITKEISERPPIVNLIQLLNKYPIIQNLEIGEEFVNTRKYAAKRSGFFDLDYHTYQKDLTGIMIDKMHPYRGIPFQGKVNNMHFGQMILHNLKNYRIIEQK